ncbi:unnamed protein product, partial [Discosporangium mesarthrocarpum]
YPECQNVLFRPSYADDGTYDTPAPPARLSPPDHVLCLEHVHGYHNHGFYPTTDNNAFYIGGRTCNPRASPASSDGGGGNDSTRGKGTGSGQGGDSDGPSDGSSSFEVVYPTAALVVMHRFSSGENGAAGGRGGDGRGGQRCFTGHNDDVTALAVHPGGVIVASGQQVCALDFSHDGWLLCSVGADRKNTANVWDWERGVLLTQVFAGPGSINAFRFNPFQAYGIPSAEPVPGQAPHVDDACYCLTSIGARHVKFWVLARVLDDEAYHGEDEDRGKVSVAEQRRLAREKARKPPRMTWVMEGSSGMLAGKGELLDFVSVTFIDDSPPRREWGPGGEVVEAPLVSDRCKGRVVVGTSDGDIYVFNQRPVRLVPREFADKVRNGAANTSGGFLDPWWLEGPGHEITTNKRIWDVGGELVENIPNSLEAANRVLLPDKANERLSSLQKKIKLKSVHPTVLKQLKDQYCTLQYGGNLSG